MDRLKTGGKKGRESLERELKSYRKNYLERAADESRIAGTVLAAQKAFYESEQVRPLSYFGFLFQQASYINKAWWVLQMGLLAGGWALLCCIDSGIRTERILGALSPVFAILLVPELWKNRSCNSMEIEGASYYSLRQIYTARLQIFAMVDVILVSIFGSAVSSQAHLHIWDIMVQFLLPFNVTCCICFRTLCSRRNYSEAFAVVLCFIWTGLWIFGILKEEIYSVVSMPVWTGAVLLSFVYLGYSVYRMVKESTDYWEENFGWN